jgi:YfiH family protein
MSDGRALSLETPIALPGGAFALFTGKDRGNLSPITGAAHQRSNEVRAKLCAELALDAISYTRQVHGARIVARYGADQWGSSPEEPADARRRYASAPAAASALDAEPSEGDTPEADGQVTTSTGLGLMALGADCVPVLLAAPGGVAAIHAGWRGLVAGVLEAGITDLRAIAGDGPIAALIGPAAGRCCYEVGPEVRQALGEEHCAGSHADLHSAARARLHAAGVNDVAVASACTICDTRLFSHRREGADAGRQAGIVWRS